MKKLICNNCLDKYRSLIEEGLNDSLESLIEYDEKFKELIHVMPNRIIHLMESSMYIAYENSDLLLTVYKGDEASLKIEEDYTVNREGIIEKLYFGEDRIFLIEYLYINKCTELNINGELFFRSLQKMITRVRKMVEILKDIKSNPSNYDTSKLKKIKQDYFNLEKRWEYYLIIFSSLNTFKKLNNIYNYSTNLRVNKDFNTIINQINENGTSFERIYEELIVLESNFNNSFLDSINLFSTIPDFIENSDNQDMGDDVCGEKNEAGFHIEKTSYDCDECVGDFSNLSHMCDCCGELIDELDYFMFKEEIPKLISLIFSYILENNNYVTCNNCLGSNLKEIIDNPIVPREYKDKHIVPVNEIIEKLELIDFSGIIKLNETTCPSCKNYFNEETGVVFQETELDFGEFDKWLHPESKLRRHSQFIKFLFYLSENPLMAVKHPLGEELYETLERKYSCCEVLKQGSKLYRGRRKSNDNKIYIGLELWNPPVEQAYHGRFNLVGTSNLYLSESLELIPREINCSPNEEVFIGEFEIVRDLKILDLSKGLSQFGKYLSIGTTQGKGVYYKEYMFTNYLASICKYIGYQGIKYSGVRNNKPYYNYVLFNFEKDKDVKINYTAPHRLLINKKRFKWKLCRKSLKMLKISNL